MGSGADRPHEPFIEFRYMDPPYRYIAPDLYPTTGPVDMLIMKKLLIVNGYRFQNSLFPPQANQGPSYAFPDNFRQRTGVFKEGAFVELFVGGQGTAGASQATLGQLRARDSQDTYLMGSNGDPIELSGDNVVL